MVSIDPPEYKIASAIRQLEKSIEMTRWWEFFKRRKLENDLFEMRCEAFEMGIELALRDLGEVGILVNVE